jgi:membrane protease YdiL (CAAX protease family)
MSIIVPAALPPSPPAPPPKRGRPILAWVVIVLAMAVAIGYESIGSLFSARFAAKVKAHNESDYLSDLSMQGRSLVGLVRSLGQSVESVDAQIQEGLHHGPYEQRLRYVILLAEVHGPAAALKQLDTMRETDWEQRPPTERESKLTNLVEKVYHLQLRQLAAAAVGGGAVDVFKHPAAGESEQPDSPLALSTAERDTLREQFDWFGQLALAPPDGDPAARAAVLAASRRTIVLEVLLVLSFLFLASVGFLLLFGGAALILTGFLRWRFLSGSRDGGVYAETFGLWMVLYMVLEVAAVFVPAGNSKLLVVGLFSLSSLVALGWPVLRGVSWRRVRQDLGWWTPGPMVNEMFWGLGFYLASLPVLLLGVLLSSGIQKVYQHLADSDPFSVPVRGSHPISEMLKHANWWDMTQILFLAAVCAPIVEETMFRGVLYRHMRELGTKWPRVLRVAFSALAVSFVFAVIHPQGVIGLPVLMALALGFALARELRGSLVGPMLAHGLNNALVTLVALSMY